MTKIQKQSVTMRPRRRKSKTVFEVVKTLNVWDALPGDLISYDEMKQMVENKFLIVNMVK